LKATLITLEVIPFLLLAVGVDNIYVLTQTLQNDERRLHESIEEQIARIVGKVGPSMLLTGTTQSLAFAISTVTPMPGVRAFSLYASLAIILNFIMQITCFVVLLTRKNSLCLLFFTAHNKYSLLFFFFKWTRNESTHVASTSAAL
jgi:Niemann-Pick C1 protein